jgi:multidrug resistance efflux pump
MNNTHFSTRRTRRDIEAEISRIETKINSPKSDVVKKQILRGKLKELQKELNRYDQLNMSPAVKAAFFIAALKLESKS